MDEKAAIKALAALAQPTRLGVFRHLVGRYPGAIAAGDIARRFDVPHNTMSSHLAVLTRAGLARAERDGRTIRYHADLDGFRAVVGFLTNECCSGRPEICAPLLADLADPCCPSPNPPRPVMPEPVYNVLFLCTGNSARSVIGEAILNREGKGRFRAYSAGSHPKGAVNPNTLSLLGRLGYDVSGFRSKSWDEFAVPGAPEFDFVFTVCDDAAGEACPVFPGRPMTAHWGIPDPAAATGSPAEVALAFDDAYRMLFQRISVFTALPIAALDQLTLQNRLKAIGAMEGATAKAKGEG